MKRKLSGLKWKLRGSTLVETLIMMLVAGIVFLTVMDGLTLFSRLQTRRMEALLSTGRQTDGYFRTLSLINSADSILTLVPGGLELYRGERKSLLSLTDSMLIYRAGEFRDTLLHGIGILQLSEYKDLPDSVQIGFGAKFTATYPVLSQAEQYRISLDEIERDYGYED